TIEYYDHASGRFYHKPFDDIHHLDFFDDNSGKIWISTMNGIYTVSPPHKKFESYQHNEADIYSLSGNHVYSFLRDRKGSMLVGANKINVFDTATKKFTLLALNNLSGLLLQNCSVLKIFQDSKNKLWFATVFGLFSYDPLTKVQHWYRSD